MTNSPDQTSGAADPSPPESGKAGPLRVMLVFEPGLDGVFRYVEALARTLVERPGIALTLAYSSVRGSRGLEELVAFLRGRGVRTLDLRVNNMPAPGDARALFQLFRLARRTRPDVIHAHSSKAGVLVRSLALLGVRARFFYTPHAYFQMYGTPGAKRRLFQGIERVFGRIGTTINVSSSEGKYARDVLGLDPARQVVLVNGVDCGRFQPAAGPEDRNTARAAFGLPPDVPLLGTVARYSEQKDPLTLYRALLPALARHPALHFAHLGKGELAPEIDGLLSSTASPEVRARIHRRESSENPAAFYRALDGFALPSRYEGFALAALEAMASGLPLVLTDCPGNNDLKDYPLDGVRWVATEDARALTEAVSAWAGALPADTNHRAVAVKYFNAFETCERLMACYNARTGG